MTKDRLLNYIGGSWQRSQAGDYLPVTNPATAQVMAEVPLSPGAEVDQAARQAAEAFQAWRRTDTTSLQAEEPVGREPR
jgi:malonate-semialdehyde dehydrogenase (acetylating)/methylmalonate-semialdehyde dehydrogenase